MRGALAAAKARAKREKNVLQSDLQKRKGREGPPALTLKAGVMLVQDWDARRKAQLLRFALTSDPLDFVAQVIKVLAAKKKRTCSHRITGRHRLFVECHDRSSAPGLFLCNTKGFSTRGWNATRPHVQAGLQRSEAVFSCGCISRSRWRVANTAVTFERHCFRKTFKTASQRQAAMIQQTTCVLSKQGDQDNVKAKFKVLYISPRSFLYRFQGSPCEAFPGGLER